jgi:membrane fusion protein (multidrug efflux system)
MNAPTDSKPETASPAKRKRIRIVLLILVLIAAIAGGSALGYHLLIGQYFQDTDDAYLHADSVTVSPKVGGYVTEVLVRDNEDVRAGQPLVIIDSRDYRAQADQYEAQISVAEANVDSIRAQIKEQEATIAQALAQSNAAKDNAGYAEREASRYAPLVAAGAEKVETLESKRNDARQTKNQAAAQRAVLQSAQRRVASLEAQVRQAQAQAQSARAQLHAAQVNLSATTIVASVDGRVGDKTVQVGQYVQTGARMMDIVPLSGLYATANFKETQLGRVRIGQPVELTIDALPGVTLYGTVESLSPGTGSEFSLLPPQNATGNFTKIVQRVPVRIALDATPEARAVLVPGMSVTAEIDTTAQKHALKRIVDAEDVHAQVRQ